NAAFVIRLFAGHVVGADHVIDRLAGPANGGSDIIARLDVRDVGTNGFDHAKRFMPQHQKVVAGRSGAVLGFVDFAIGGVDADLQNADQHAAAARHVVDLGLRQIGQMDAVGLTGSNGNGFHGKPT